MSSAAKFKNDLVVNQLSVDEKRWFALYTKYKCEKYVADHLVKKNIESYVPVIIKTRKYARKVKHFQVPLINCYVFVRIDKSQYLPALETEFAMKFLRQGKDLLAIPSAEMDLLMRVAGDVSEAHETNDHSFETGEDVEVVSGHLTGMQGKIISKAGKKNFVIALETIGFQLMINIDLKFLKPINNRMLIS